MKYLVDTNVFFHTINSNIYGVAKKCIDIGDIACITQTILDELTPGYYLVENESTKGISTAVSLFASDKFKLIELINISDVDGAKELLKSIRDGFYSWMHKADYLQMLLEKGEITVQEIKSKTFKNKDLGECELLAIAKASHGAYILITNDKGEVFHHPYQNIFEPYKDDPEVVIYNGAEWISKIGYVEESE